MLTQNEITALNLSPTKKDFVQIWNELLEVAGKLSERWDPTSTNESDPGIVLLKALTGIADKLNYTIDKNILEAFMPTAAQEDSMRKLCDMLGYNMKYYRSAETAVTIKYYNQDLDDNEDAAMSEANGGYGMILPKFTVITNGDKDISYFTTSQSSYIHSTKSPSVTVSCMEGQIVKCESSNNNNVINANQISENNRFYLPETMIAENGIFIYNVAIIGDNLADGEQWRRVDNLNTQARDAKVFKFGYDSYESRPYIEFPEDYSKLFNDGIFLYYARTSGINGNVSPRTLTQIELPTTGAWADVKTSSFSVENITAATTGANAETIKQAYNNFKKTVGTFETLVTCRDYMNKIYSLIDNKGKALVSNILVTDIRNDLNKAVTICSCDDAGIFYKEVPLSSNIPVSENTKPVFDAGAWHLGNASGIALPTSFVETEGFDYTRTGDTFVKEGYWYIKQVNNNKKTVEYKTGLQVGATEQAINHFDIVFYPYKSYNQIRSNVKDIRAVYDASFTYSEDKLGDIEQQLASQDIKTISHNIKKPEIGDVLSINNYLRLSATIATNAKVAADEDTIIIDKIKIALANAFNMRELDFGDEIPFDSIVEVIENADTRIKVASLNEPALYTTFSVLERREKNNKPVIVEYAVASDWLDIDIADKTNRLTKTIQEKNSEGVLVDREVSTFDTVEARKIYNKLAIRNVLAGRIPLFNYNTSFTSSFSEGTYQVTTLAESVPSHVSTNKPDIWTEKGKTYVKIDDSHYTETYSKYADNVITESVNEDGVDNYITDIKANCKLIADENGKITDVTLADGEFVKFRAPNFITEKTYPAYVNYHLVLSSEEEKTAVAAEAESLLNILNADLNDYSESNKNIKWQKVLDYFTELDTQQGYTSNKDSYKKTFRLEQAVSAFNETEEKPVTSTITTLGVELENNQVEAIDYTPEQLMALSGCIKLKNEGYRAQLEWQPEEGEEAPADNLNDLVEVVLSDFKSPFITNINVLSAMKTAVDSALNTYRDRLPRQCAWKISFEFECVPFEPRSLDVWEAFIKHCADYPAEQYQILGTKAENSDTITFWKPVEEYGVILWRIFSDGYEVGKYVTKDTEKLLPFTKNYFGLLPNIRLSGIFLVKNIGRDAVPTIVRNNEEYQLQKDEYLYIEYTPSTTTEDGNSQATEPVTKIYEEGTIIRPSGFEGEGGLVDSDKLAASAHKQVKFFTTDRGQFDINMYSLGASEQIEIRDFARVSITSDDFQTIYVYKNFNGCPELENENGNASGSRTYTLKDGEAIFYTDQNKSEFAYYTSGTSVTLTGSKFTIGEFDTVELATILDSGLQEIPWERKTLKDKDSITFQEYQYITLGSEDVLNSLQLEPDPKKDINDLSGLDDTWKYCSNVEYTLAGDPDNPIVLPKINLQGTIGNGWEANCTLELNVSPSVTQTLRSTDKIETSLTLTRASTSGGALDDEAEEPTKTIKPTEGYYGTALPISFKTNLACLACGNEININDVWSNPNNLKGFQVKVLAKDSPAIVQTKPGTVAPYNYTGDFAAWAGSPLEEKEYLELWNRLDLKDIKYDEKEGCDNALRLPISLLPNTYGVFSIYVNSAQAEAEVWIEVIPGTKATDVELLNTRNAKLTFIEGSNNTQLHKLYLNQGINCIRVNTNAKLFIKAASGANGTLYFDELRLVNSLPIKYNDTDITLNTKGLNIAQLGYLDSSDDVKSSLTATAKEKLQEAYAEDLYISVNELVQLSDKAFTEEYDKLVGLLPKVRVLVDTEKRIAEELEKIKNLDNARFVDLSTKYRDISETLNKEKTLLEALNGNTEADKLEIRLVDLLDSFMSIEDEQQQILSELNSIRAKAEANLKNVSDEAILVDFNTSPSGEGSDKENALQKIKAEVIRRIEVDYQEQLATIASSLDSSINSTSNTALVTIFERLRNNATAHIRDMLQTKVNALSSIVENDATALAEELVDLVYEIDADVPDYAAFLDRLNELRSTVVASDIKTLVSEIAPAVEETNDQQLKNLLLPLFPADSFDSGDPSVESILNYGTDGLVTKIDTLAGYAYTNNLTSLKNETTGIKSLANSIATDYETALVATFKALRDAIVALSDETVSLDNILADLASLASTEDSVDETSTSQAQVVIGQLSAIISERNGLIKEVNELVIDNINDSACKPLIYEAILIIWPKYIEARGVKLLDAIANTFVNAIKQLSDAETTDPNGSVLASESKIGMLYDSETDCMKLLLDTVSIETLFSKIALLNKASKQRESEIEDIMEISGLLLDSDALITAINANSSNSSNKVIKDLIDQWSAANSSNNVKQKQKIQAKLKDALTNAIGTQEQLFTVISGILCPELTKATAGINELIAADKTDNFYTKLASKLNELKEAIIKGIQSLAITDDNAYLELLELPPANFKTALLEFSMPSTSLLPNTGGLEGLTEKLVTATKQANDLAILENQHLSTLSSEKLRELSTLLITDATIQKYLDNLCAEVDKLDQLSLIDVDHEDAFKILKLEDQLLDEISAIDVNREFYYTTPISPSFAIDLNESISSQNTLLNPQMNYDINNVNNSFVISKLDIDFLDSGIQIARSSRLN